MASIAKRDVGVVIAAYNEERHIGDVVRRTRKQGFSNVIVADDGSRDRTAALAQAAGATVVRHVVNLGKGAAMKTGAEYALKQGAKVLLFLDGDGQHRPEEAVKLLRKLEQNDIVFGSRSRSSAMPPVMRFGNWFISAIIRLLYHIDLQDSQCGYRALTAHAYRCVRWGSRDYRVESEIIARAGKRGLRYTEVPITTIYHDKYKGTTFLDGFPIVWNLIVWRLVLRKP